MHFDACFPRGIEVIFEYAVVGFRRVKAGSGRLTLTACGALSIGRLTEKTEWSGEGVFIPPTAVT